jgi:hypothetical protein
MKKLILLMVMAFAGSIAASNAQGYDPNYKHQSGKKADTSINYISYHEVSGNVHHANYKHQAGRKPASTSKAVTIPVTTGGQDRNYKHQFPAR